MRPSVPAGKELVPKVNTGAALALAPNREPRYTISRMTSWRASLATAEAMVVMESIPPMPATAQARSLLSASILGVCAISQMPLGEDASGGILPSNGHAATWCFYKRNCVLLQLLKNGCQNGYRDAHQVLFARDN